MRLSPSQGTALVVVSSWGREQKGFMYTGDDDDYDYFWGWWKGESLQIM